MLIEKWTKDDRVLEIHSEEDPLNPRKEFDPLGVMYCWHKKYILGDKQPNEPPAEVHQFVIFPDGGPVLPLYLLDHSGLTIGTGPFGCLFDSRQVGYIHMPKEMQKREDLTDEQALEMLKAEVETYNQYLSGEIYGFIIYTLEPCSECGHEHRVDEDSCGGFYGSDHKASGLLEQAGIESLEGWTNANR